MRRAGDTVTIQDCLGKEEQVAQAQQERPLGFGAMEIPALSNPALGRESTTSVAQINSYWFLVVARPRQGRRDFCLPQIIIGLFLPSLPLLLFSKGAELAVNLPPPRTQRQVTSTPSLRSDSDGNRRRLALKSS